ncbi:MAG: methionyl-tRNA formyltransferase [Bacteroidales bacterium]
MEPKELRIVFMGTPEVAVQSLKDLVENGYQVVAVVTAPDKPAGRGRKLTGPPVKEYALQQNLKVLQPQNLKSSDFLDQLKAVRPDVQVVVAFRMLPEQVWSLPPLGTFNMHASLLPQYRGAAPINWAVINGEQQSGVTTFLLDHLIDTGKILFREPINLEPDETAGSLHEKVKHEGSKLVMRTLDAIAHGNIRPLDQQALTSEQPILKKAPKIFKEDCRIDWNQPVQQVANHIHGLSPHPGAFTTIETAGQLPMTLKIYEVVPERVVHHDAPGTLISDNKKQLGFTTPDGIIWVKSLQLPGKRRMNTEEVLRGHSF